MTEPTDAHIEPGALEQLPDILTSFAAQRVLVVTTPVRRFGDRTVRLLEAAGMQAQCFDGARVHVPRSTVDAAAQAIRETRADTVVTIGGGSATGLGKILRRDHGVRFVAVPTTYAGSEMTSIWAVTDEDKETGRDERVRPDAVLYDPELTYALPMHLTVQSLLNATAQAVGALSTGSLDEAGHARALRAVRVLIASVRELVVSPRHRQAREDALRGASLAGRALDTGRMGMHHQLAHLLGGRFDLPHAALHAVLLPHSVGALESALREELSARTGSTDLPGELFDLCARAGAPRSLRELDLEWRSIEQAISERAQPPAEAQRLARAAWLGRRPSMRVRRQDWGQPDPVALDGPSPAHADHVVIALHGRGATAEAALRQVREIAGDAPGLAIVAPQADDGVWYPKSYRAPIEDHGEHLERALGIVDEVASRVLAHHPAERISLFGFSQGACLALEWATRRGHALAHVIAAAGARIGPSEQQPTPSDGMAATRLLLAIAEQDPWVDVEDVRRSAEALERAGTAVERLIAPGDAHAIATPARLRIHELLRGGSLRDGQSGFGNAHASEALEGALPIEQNSPRHPPYGLWAEQVSGTGFVTPRADNLRCWLYRIRPSVQHRAFAPREHPTFGAGFVDRAPEADLCGWRPLTIPEQPTDFLDGLVTLGGAGDPTLRRGYAAHVYAANRNMEHRAFYNADGDLLIVPQLGTLTLLTELGALDVTPGRIALVPRGLKLTVLLHEAAARGYVAETFGRHFELPDRGPVGANGLADARHFIAPRAWYEDRLDPGFELVVKMGGRLHATTQDYSPFDVVAWHGNYAPYVYDLMRFSPVGNTRFDHGDPSIYTVLTAPMDERGTHTLDFVVFPPRWDPTEGTFRPPYFHRNVTTEINGIIRQPATAKGPFQPGVCFLTPSMTAHGVAARSVERVLAMDDEQADRPTRHGDDSLWFQFETGLPMSLTPWAATGPTRIPDWRDVWGQHRTRFTPPSE